MHVVNALLSFNDACGRRSLADVQHCHPFTLTQKREPLTVAQDKRSRADRGRAILLDQNARLRGKVTKLEVDVDLLKSKVGLTQDQTQEALKAKEEGNAKLANLHSR